MKTGKELYDIYAHGACLSWEKDLTDRDRMRWEYLSCVLNGQPSDVPFADTDLLDARVTALENDDLLESRVRALEEIVTKYRPSYDEVQKMIDNPEATLKVGDKVLFNWMGVRVKGTVGCFPGEGWVTIDGRTDSTGYTFRIDDPACNLRRAEDNVKCSVGPGGRT